MADLAERYRVLPAGVLPLGLSRVQASVYIGVSPSIYDAMVEDGRMPKPKRIGRRRVWDRRAVEEFFARLDAEARESAGNSRDDDWDDVAP